MRRPAVLKPVGWLTGRAALWAAIRKERRFGLRDLARRAGVSEDSARDYVRALAKAGVLSAEGGGIGKPVTYTLERDCGVDAPRVGRDGSLRTAPTARERLWAAMKALRDFDAAELAMAAAANEVDATSYVGALHRAGYLHCVRPARPPSRGRARYRLRPAMNSGPRPPAIRRDKSVFDLNLGRTVWAPPRQRAPEGAGGRL